MHNIFIKKTAAVLFFAAALSASAACDLLFNWNIGDVIAGYEIGKPVNGKEDSWYFEQYLFNFFFKDTKTGLGLFASPFRVSIKEKNNYIFTFCNLNLNLDFLKKYPNFMLGPFAEVNILGVKNIKHYEFSAGLQFFIKYDLDLNKGYLTFNVVNFKTGYKLINNRHTYFIQAGVDLMALFLIIGRSAFIEAKRKKDPYFDKDVFKEKIHNCKNAETKNSTNIFIPKDAKQIRQGFCKMPFIN